MPMHAQHVPVVSVVFSTSRSATPIPIVGPIWSKEMVYITTVHAMWHQVYNITLQ